MGVRPARPHVHSNESGLNGCDEIRRLKDQPLDSSCATVIYPSCRIAAATSHHPRIRRAGGRTLTYRSATGCIVPARRHLHLRLNAEDKGYQAADRRGIGRRSIGRGSAAARDTTTTYVYYVSRGTAVIHYREYLPISPFGSADGVLPSYRLVRGVTTTPTETAPCEVIVRPVGKRRTLIVSTRAGAANFPRSLYGLCTKN